MNQKMKWLLLGFYRLHCWCHSCFIPKVNWTWTQKIKRLRRVSVTAGPSGNSPLKWMLIRFVKGLSLCFYVHLCWCCSTLEYWFTCNNIILTNWASRFAFKKISPPPLAFLICLLVFITSVDVFVHLCTIFWLSLFINNEMPLKQLY